jgi:hypothetical protein
MRNHVCWLCKGNTSHQMVADPTRLNTMAAMQVMTQGDQLVIAAYRCGVCKAISVAIAEAPAQLIGPSLGNWIDSDGNLSDTHLTWRPSASDTRDYPDVPAHIAAAATEAFECHSDGHYRAAILLARSVIEATAKDKGITSGNLQTKIQEMERQNLIRPNIEAMAHGIRGYGNEMAHGDFVAPLSAEESALVIELMGEILNEVYQAPARLTRVQQAFTARQQGSGQA